MHGGGSNVPSHSAQQPLLTVSSLLAASLSRAGWCRCLQLQVLLSLLKASAAQAWLSDQTLPWDPHACTNSKWPRVAVLPWILLEVSPQKNHAPEESPESCLILWKYDIHSR